MSVLEITTYGRNTLRRLRIEARLVAATPAPGLAWACERDRSSPTPALVSEYVPDVTLDDLISIAPLPAAAALHALQDVARTLDAMHACALSHGDLRPGTVYVLPDGRAALAQPADLPPATGSRSSAGRCDDALRFAMLAFELLTGDHPRDVGTAAARATSVPSLPRAAALALERALAATPSRRPSPIDLVTELDAVPPEDWPSNHLHRPAPVAPVAPSPTPSPTPSSTPPPSTTLRSGPAEPDPEPGPATVEPSPAPSSGPAPRPETGPGVVRILPPRPRKRRWRRVFELFVIMLGLATVLTGGGVGAWLLFAAPTATADDPAAAPPRVARVALSVTPPQAHCPRAVLHLAATVVIASGAGDLELRWQLPDGTTAETQRLSVDEGRRTVRAALDLSLNGYRQVRGEIVAIVSPGGTRATAPLRYLCPSAKERPDRSRSA